MVPSVSAYAPLIALRVSSPDRYRYCVSNISSGIGASRHESAPHFIYRLSMNKKLLGTAVIAASTAAFTSGCGILQSVELPDLELPKLALPELPNVRFDTNTYVVQPGDTLQSVSDRYEIDPDSLIAVNSLQLAELVPGQRLILLRGKEIESLAARANPEMPIDGAPAAIAGQPIAVPNATQTTVTASPQPVADPTIIRSDVLVPNQGVFAEGSEEIIGVVTNDALLDEQPIFVSENGAPPPLPQTTTQTAGIERPQGIETIIQEVNANPNGVIPDVAVPDVAMVEPANIPTAGTIEIVDAAVSGQSAKRITVNNQARGWNWPALGTITREFDLREINRQGLDIDPGPGAAVQAAADGEVVYSGRDLASHGNLVILRHDDNYLSAYSKVSDIFVKENQVVKAGDLIASVGGDKSGGNEIHFEIRRNGEPVNPIDYLPAL